MAENINIPKHWEIRKFEELLKYIQPTPFIVESTDYSDKYDTPVLTAGKSFILGRTNEKHNVFESIPVIIFDDFTTASKYVNFSFKVKSSAMKILQPKNESVNLKFVFYYMQTIQLTFDTHKRYWISVYSQLPIPLPPLPEQQAIVAKIEELFSELDKGIESLKTAQQQLTVYRQSLLKAAFEGKLTAQWRSEQHTTDFSLAAEPKTKYLAQGDLPEGWKKEKLGVVCEIKNGKNQKIVENPNGKYPIYGSAGKMGYANSYLCEAGSTIVGRKGTINKPLYVNEKFWNVDTAFGFIPKTDLIINRFLYFFCLSFNFSKLDKSTTIPSLAKTDLQKIDVILPSIDEQQLIVSELESKLTVCDKMEETINESLQQAETLRQSILKRAFEGRLVNYEIENVNYIDG